MYMSGLRVLILEDFSSDAELAIAQLKRDGIAVAHWRRVDTEADLRLALADEWDILLADYHLPCLTALDALRIVRERECSLPTLVVSGTVGEELAAALIKAGAYDYVHKDRIGRLGSAVTHALTAAELRATHLRDEAALEASVVRLARALDGAVHALGAAAEMRDPYTAGHQRRVAQLAVTIARRMRLPEGTIRGLHVAALLHDIGKLRIPGDILTKPTRLSPPEYSLIKMHAEAGADILRGIEFPWPVADIVRQHHCRIDGSGYPEGIPPETLLVEALIVGVADVVEAMSSHRPYRAALGVAAALAEIADGRGTRYPPDIADACAAVFTEDGFQFEADGKAPTGEWGTNGRK
jgi:putative two-component system response regulator